MYPLGHVHWYGTPVGSLLSNGAEFIPHSGMGHLSAPCSSSSIAHKRLLVTPSAMFQLQCFHWLGHCKSEVLLGFFYYNTHRTTVLTIVRVD